MSFGDAPTPPNPNATSDAQAKYNLQAAQAQNKNNSYNQETSYGGVTYVADPNSPSGYTIKSALSAPQQQLLDTRQGTQQIAGQTAQDLMRNTSGMYSQAPDLNGASGAVASKLNDWSARYLQPIYNQQSSNLEAQLRNQGLTPGSEAYNNAKNLLARNQGDTTNQYLQQNQGQAFQQALASYQAPLQTIAGLYGAAAPANLNPTLQSAPQAQIQPPNYSGAVNNNYTQQMQNYEQNNANMGKLLVAGAGLAAAPFTGGLSLGATAGGLGGMFGGGGGVASTMNYGGQSWPAYT
jgi:hypothetical protein